MTDLVSQRLRLLGQPVRIKIVECLRLREMTVQELTTAIGGTQQNVSQHLVLLRQAGILGRRKMGTRVWYQLIDPHAPRLLDEARTSVARQLGQLAQLIDRPRD
jgi:DNA-binding transcriptional ArsR family regulator